MRIVYSNKANLPTEYGEFKIVSFKDESSSIEHCFLYFGEVIGRSNVLTRIHSECLTGDVFKSSKCDCGPQLDESIRAIAKKGSGIIIYLRQEGRGIGLFNKINAYSLQDNGQDTIEANHTLGFKTDQRDFSVAVEVIKHLKIHSIELLSNNPDKLNIWNESGIIVSNRVPLIIEPNPYNQDYLSTKKKKLNHLL